MEQVRLNENEWKVMKIIWEKEPVQAKEVADEMTERYGIQTSSTYVILSHLLDKGVIDRNYPKYTINTLISRSEMQKREVQYILDQMFDGSRRVLFSSFIEDENLSKGEIAELKEILKQAETK